MSSTAHCLSWGLIAASGGRGFGREQAEMERRGKTRVKEDRQEERSSRWRTPGWQSQRGFCKDERKVCVCFYGIRWSALILSLRVRSRHNPPSRPYIFTLLLNSGKTHWKQEAKRGWRDPGKVKLNESAGWREERRIYLEQLYRDGFKPNNNQNTFLVLRGEIPGT